MYNKKQKLFFFTSKFPYAYIGKSLFDFFKKKLRRKETPAKSDDEDWEDWEDEDDP